jgi:MMP 1-O-methyltransferase
MEPSQLPFFTPDENRRWSEIRGRLLPAGAELLHRFASESDWQGAAVEIGSFAGKSTICISRGVQKRGKENAHVFAIDTLFQSDFANNLAAFGVSDLVERVESSSLEVADAWRKPISFLYIDAHHGKAHGYADLLAWDAMVIRGGFVVLDDTGGFLLGPNLQLQAALRTGAYHLVAEAGGMSVLRKQQAILPFISDFPLGEGSLIAYTQYVSAWLGAMNLDFRAPSRPRPLPSAEHSQKKSAGLFSRFLKTKAAEPTSRTATTRGQNRATKSYSAELERVRKTLEWLSTSSQGGITSNTLSYLSACFDLRTSRTSAAIEKLKTLCALGRSLQLLHYKIGVREMSTLRLAQAYDLSDQRELATDFYNDLIRESAIPELKQQAKLGLSQPFRIPAPDENLLLREYAFELAEYRNLTR